LHTLSRTITAAIAALLIALTGACGGGGSPINQPAISPNTTTLPTTGGAASAAPDLIFNVIMRPQQPEELPLKGASWLTPSSLLNRLPALPNSKDPSCTGSGFLMAGGDYSDELLNSHVSREGDEDQHGRYAPQWTGGPIEDAAYAVYRWNLRGFTGNQTVGFTWGDGEEPSTWRNFWVGLGNLAQDSWDWYKGPEDSVLTVDSFGPYRAAGGDMLMIVLLLGEDEALLEKMEAGVPEQRATGEVEDLPGDVPEYPLLGFSGSLPASMDVSAGCAPINDQLTWGACTAFAVGDGAFNFELERVYGPLGWDLTRDHFRVSPKYLYLTSGEHFGYPPGGGYGRWTAEVIQSLETDGIATEEHAPYDLVYAKNWSAQADTDAAVLSADDWEEIPCNTWEGIETVKAVLALQQKPLPMRIYLDSSFFDYTAGGTWFPLGPSVGGHAMCIVGYDDERGDVGAFKVRNSWSEYWGDNGYVWIDYRAFLLPGTSVRAWTLDEDYSAGVVDRFNLATPGTPPPVAVEASDGTSTEYIEVTWLPHPSASELHIYRDKQDNLVATVSGSVTSWQDTSITDSYGHIYWVQADSSMLSPPDVGFIAALPEILSVEPTSGLEGSDVTFVAGGTGSGPLYYDWSFGGGATPSTSTDPRPEVTFTTPGVYSASVTVENALGGDTYNFDVTVNGTPPLVNYIEHKSGFSGDVITLGANLSGTPTHWSWEFSGGATPASSTDSEPDITLGAPGIYQASLEVSSPWGGDTYYFELAVLDPILTDWPTPGHDGRASGQSPVIGPQTNNLKWKYYAGFPESLHTSRALEVLVLADNSLIVSSRTVEGSALRRLNADGSLVWINQYYEEYSSYGQPIIGDYSGKLYVSRGNVIQALDPADGSLAWQYEPPDETYTVSPRAESSNGLLYVVVAGKYLAALDAVDGSQAFEPIQLADKYNVLGPSLIAPNGTMFLSSEFGYDDLLIAFDTAEAAPAGSLMIPQPAASMALSADGRTLFLTDGDGDTRAFDTYTCRQLWWQSNTSGAYFGSTDVRVMADGTAVVTNEKSQVFALDPETGEILWDYDLGLEDDCYGASAIGRDGTIYVGGSNKKLYAVRDDALIWESADAGAWYFNGDPAIGPDGTVYCGADDGWLYAFGPGSGEELVPAYVLNVTPTEGDSGQEVTFSADVQGTAPLSYSWNFGGGAVPNTSSDPGPTVTLGDIGTYSATLEVSNSYGSHAFAFTLRSLSPGGNTPPTAVLDADVTAGSAPLTVTFDASGSSDLEGPIVLYEWAPAGDHVYDPELAGPSPELEYTYTLPGTYEAWVRVTDLDDATDEDRLLIEVSGDQEWHIYTVDGNADAGNMPDLLEVNGRPAISYATAESPRTLYYIRAADATGSSWDSRISVSAASNPNHNSLAIIGGYPALAFITLDDHQLNYARAQDQNGATWNSPQALASPGSDGSAGAIPALAEVNGKPAVAFYDSNAYGDPYYIRANDATGTSWPGSATRIDSSSNDRGMYTHLIIADGYPAVSYYDADDDDLYFTRAGNADGSSWGTPLLIAGGGPGGDNAGNRSHLTLVDGLPAVTYWMPAGLFYQRASDAAGSSWNQAYSITAGITAAPCYAGGELLVLALGSDWDEIWAQRASDLNGSSWYPPESLDPSGNFSLVLDMENIGGHPAACWYEATDKYLLYAVYY